MERRKIHRDRETDIYYNIYIYIYIERERERERMVWRGGRYIETRRQRDRERREEE